MDNKQALSFPPMPGAANKDILKPSASFKKNIYRSTGAILLFVIVYLLLFFGAIGIAILFGVFGVFVMTAKLGFLTLVLGLAIIASGLLLVYFVIKSLFNRTHTDYSGMIEVTPADQPKLFEFINRLTAEAGAPIPKHIFLSADVNAGVFYDSSFWSMFLPVKKNLKIGLGLVNSLNVSEFKAVIAHEFGHFSQRSMKFGSYVYNVNKVIYNMLYENDGYGRVLNALSRVHGLFTLAAYVNIWIIRGMQYLLKKVYIVLNKSYMSLSREMEFHADAMGAYVSGSNNMVTSLRRIEVGQACYSELMDYWGTQLADKKRAENFYPQHLELIKTYAKKNNLPLGSAGLPLISGETNFANVSQVVIEDQWSSHPSNEDREARLTAIGLSAPQFDEPAWAIFNNPEQLQLLLTNDVYSRTEANGETHMVSFESFKAEFFKADEDYTLDKRYRGYYDERFINQFDVDVAVAEATGIQGVTFEGLLSEDNYTLPAAIGRMQRDIYILESITDASTDVKTFDYKGIKYKRDKAALIIQKIESERTEAAGQLDNLDKRIFMYFYNACRNEEQREVLVSKYKRLFMLQTDSATDFEMYNNIMRYFNKVYQTMPFEQITDTVNAVYKEETQVKPRIKKIFESEETQPYFSPEQANATEKYLSTEWVYFNKPSYDQNAINAFDQGINAYMSAIYKRNFDAKKDVLTFQADMLNTDDFHKFNQ
jgi:Zn-dependent protease with chaperone function